MHVRSGIPVLIFLLLTLEVVAQVRPRYSQYIFHPYLYNPAHAAKAGQYELNLNHRRQWMGIQDAPVVSTVSLQRGFRNGMTGGMSAYNYSRGLIHTNNFQLTVGYQARFGQEHSLQMGVAGMATYNSLDYSRISNTDDPAIMTSLSNKAVMDGQFGINYRLQNLNVGFTLASLMNRSTVAMPSHEKAFQPLNHYVVHADYRFHLAQDQFILQPYALYFASPDSPAQWEAGSILYLYQKVHLGGAYRQTQQATVMVGFTINKSLALGYAYDFAVRKTNAMGQGSHELQLRFRFGKPTDEKLVTKTEPIENPIEVEENGNEMPQDQPKSGRAFETTDTVKKGQASDTKEPLPTAQTPEKVAKQTTEKMPDVTVDGSKQQQISLQQKTYQAGNHQDELHPGYYAVAGVFAYKANAVAFTADLWQQSYKAAYGFNSQTGYYYVYLSQDQNRRAVQLETLRLRKNTGFEQVWLLHIEPNNQKDE